MSFSICSNLKSISPLGRRSILLLIFFISLRRKVLVAAVFSLTAISVIFCLSLSNSIPYSSYNLSDSTCASSLSLSGHPTNCTFFFNKPSCSFRRLIRLLFLLMSTYVLSFVQKSSMALKVSSTAGKMMIVENESEIRLFNSSINQSA